MKKTSAFLIAALLATPFSLGPAEPASASACTLTGAGTSGDPWLVGSDSDFQKVADSPCLSSGFYKQTANITLSAGAADVTPSGFSGSYDGDFYTITLAGAWSNGTQSVTSLFNDNVSGTLKKLYIAGHLKPASTIFQAAPLAYTIKSGGIVSQVKSTVNVTITDNRDTIKLSGMVQRLSRGALMEYSSASGTLSWEPTTAPGTRYQYYAGLVADIAIDSDGFNTTAGTTRSVEIRDSYSRVTVKWPSAARCYAYFGGIVGATQTVGSDVYLIRTYSASQFDPSTNTSTVGCASGFPKIGGLYGRSDNSGRRLGTFTGGWTDPPPAGPTPTYVYSVSSFWAKDLIGNVANSIGGDAPSGSTNQYVSGLPRAVGLSSDYLKTLSTFQSKESATTGIPDVASNLAVGSSTGGYTTNGTLDTNEATFRWAIESGNVLAFVPPPYPTAQPTPPTTAFFNRTVIADTTVPASMAGRGQVNLEGPATGYPTLGRVWEICEGSNDGFPVLVWEEQDCSGEGSGGGSGGSSSESETAQPALAATGPSTTATVLLALIASAMTVFGALLFRRSRRFASGS